MATFKCPNCNEQNIYVFDEKLARELARKELGLDKNLDERTRTLELENKELSLAVDSLRRQVEENASNLKKLEIKLETKLLPELKGQLAEEITQLIVRKAKRKSTFGPV